DRPTADDVAARPEECWIVDLAPVADGYDVARAVAATLGLRAGSDETTVAEVARQLAGRAVLIVLDNCEHVLAASATLLAELVAACPKLRVIATSRASLRVPGEAIHAVRPLSLPDPSAPLGRVVASEAVRLFVERASTVSAAFQPTGEALDVVGDI